MKLYYIYPYVLPLCGTVIDDYQILAQKYFDNGLLSEYWNSLLRILLRKYGMPINRFYKSAMKSLVEDKLSVQSVSTWFHDSFVYKQLFCNDKLNVVNIENTTNTLNKLLSSFFDELRNLDSKRKELNNTYSINILPDIQVSKFYPTIGNEKWECGTLISNFNLKLNVSALNNIN